MQLISSPKPLSRTAGSLKFFGLNANLFDLNDISLVAELRIKAGKKCSKEKWAHILSKTVVTTSAQFDISCFPLSAAGDDIEVYL